MWWLLILCGLASSSLVGALSTRFKEEYERAVQGKNAKFCCSDYYTEPTVGATEYAAQLVQNQKMSCSSPIDTEKCGTIVATRNSHTYGVSPGIHCIESESCLECLRHFQILCGPGYTWDHSTQKCAWKIDIQHGMQYDMGIDAKYSHGDHSCIVLDKHGYALNSKYNNPNYDDCSDGYCYGAFYNTDPRGAKSTVVGSAELSDMGLTWNGHSVSRPPTALLGHTLAPAVSPTSVPELFTDTTSPNGKPVNKTTLREMLLNGFCCSRFFNDGVIGSPKEVFREGKEFLPDDGTTNSRLINMGIADGSLAIGRRLSTYEYLGETPTFEGVFFGGHKACGHAPPIDTKCGRVVDAHGLELQDKEMTQYLGGAHCGTSTGTPTPCKACMEANVIACADGWSFDEAEDKCVEGGVCAEFEHECHVQPEDQLYADPMPCLAASGHIEDLYTGDDATSESICSSAVYKAPRACVFDRKKQKCKAGIYFEKTAPGFQQMCDEVNRGVVMVHGHGLQLVSGLQLEWQCESTIYEETRFCQSTERVAYGITCTSLYGTSSVSCDPTRRTIPQSPDTDDVCEVLLNRQGKRKSLFSTEVYDDHHVMNTLQHLCHFPKESDTARFVEWIEGLSNLEIVALLFLLIPVFGTVLCTANAVFKWNTGCLKACCSTKQKSFQRSRNTPTIESKYMRV